MAVTPTFLGGGQLAVSAAALYTAPAGVHAVVKAAVFTNVSGAAVTITVYRVPSAGSPGAANTLLSAFSIAAGAAYIAKELQNVVLGVGDSIQALASAATAVTYSVSGFTF